jgi:hypothetical protein
MNATDYSTWSTNDLASHYSDYHKDFHGWRPRDWENLETKENLIKAIKAIDEAFDCMLQSEQGRKALREDGWLIK